MKNILDLKYEELVNEFQRIGLEKYRVDQVLNWIYKKKVFEFEKMTNLSKEHRKLLSEKFFIDLPKLLDMQISKIDKTTKFLWELRDGNTIESVALFHSGRVTACISTQVGCPVKCEFCATGQSGFVRNLTVGEIVSQILAIELNRKIKVGNVVYMGMGEPLLNFENVIDSIKMLNDKKMLNIGIRRITVSTVGIPEKIIALAESGLNVKLALSLHAVTDYKRDQIIPLNKKYSVEELIYSLRKYQEITGNRVTIEYILIREFNDYPEDAIRLVELLRGLSVYVNLIPINPVNPKFHRPNRWALERFKEILEKNGIECEIRKEKGTDIDAACGQLRRRKLR
ncbi:50S rRNA methyltransferase [Thermosipho melanesiensis]|uniref:Probable dual-specificity RNA methyltransferase RlmN n=2 Tax=Thermosipho melanesiensis TaxID=46541 RepID=RLMN_THEM4|nr:23S rRNA (adenine(2503)-C(2))-methyltransferase RlmN [Thermosipho melanesiensis]A6LN47.1 RecName: Full=Probable dual-specificity RNA methyltransferase RlmN; AltName: Full=23S rRNA (adenine(2503)-C(2))-methyltransferase; AltName: Full=23S rRNA m2A2503 methyltransferase; AltName: Full=Ribosomal RNA large subunit methyltransferase N; AltName: Full=tRNA (adenine(37)-C(2))-methyltransferase; AltName: Full=tRNA m2A37 methyltransferase [Thermosipho melanesiensis BI429]ABR31348.1 radical SAM enzyme, C